MPTHLYPRVPCYSWLLGQFNLNHRETVQMGSFVTTGDNNKKKFNIHTCGNLSTKKGRSRYCTRKRGSTLFPEG